MCVHSMTTPLAIHAYDVCSDRHRVYDDDDMYWMEVMRFKERHGVATWRLHRKRMSASVCNGSGA